jgi:hypothetical protein
VLKTKGDKEMCTVSVVLPLLWPTPVCFCTLRFTVIFCRKKITNDNVVAVKIKCFMSAGHVGPCTNKQEPQVTSEMCPSAF